MATLDLPSEPPPEKTAEVVTVPAEAPTPARSEPVTAKTPAIRLDLEETVEIPPQAPVVEVEVTQPMQEALDAPDLDEMFALAEQREEAPQAEVPPLGEDPMQSALAASDEPPGEDFAVGVERHEEIVLRPSSTSEYQVPSDADLLGGRGSGGFAPRFEEDMPASMAPADPEPEETADESASPAGLWKPSPEDASSPEPEEVAPPSLEHFEPFVPPAAAPADMEEEVPEELEPEAEEPMEEPEPAGVEMVSPESDLLVTETMGDVYAAQGHHAEALEVYRQLLVRSPDDDGLKDKVARLQRRASPPPAVQSPRGFGAAQTGGQSVSAYFGDLLSARLEESGNGAAVAPAAETSAPADGDSTPTMDEAFNDAEGSSSGEPTRPASGPLSLSAIFGEDSSPVPPVVAGPEATEPAERKPGSSFDEFFGERPAPPAGGTRVRTIRHSDGDQDDLEQFHKWLKGLKR
jgi:hypothetical protein